MMDADTTPKTLFGMPVVEADIGIKAGEIVFGDPSKVRLKVRVVSRTDNGDGTWTIGVRYEDEDTCQQPPSGTRPSASGTQEPGETTHTPVRSGDTDASGGKRQPSL